MTERNSATAVAAQSPAMSCTCFYDDERSIMIQLQHVPDALHHQLKARAALAGLSLSDFLVRAVRKLVEQPTPQELRDQLRRRSRYTGQLSPTEVLRSERDSH